MRRLEPPRDLAEPAIDGMAVGATVALGLVLLSGPVLRPALMMEAPKPTAVTLSVVEEAPPPPPPPAEVAPPPEPQPPPQLAPSPLPPPPPPRPHHVVRMKHPLPPHPIEAPDVPQVPVTAPPAPNFARSAQQAPENHSAEAAFVGRLHALVARNTLFPSGAAYRLSHPSGEVLVGFVLSRAGALSGVHVLRSSGSAMLDTQGVEDVSRLRYPPMPDDVYPGQAAHAFSVPVAFPDMRPAEDE